MHYGHIGLSGSNIYVWTRNAILNNQYEQAYTMFALTNVRLTNLNDRGQTFPLRCLVR